MVSSVSIIGCGWLGQALAMQLKSHNIPVLASYQSQQRQQQLQTLAIDSVALALPIVKHQAKNIFEQLTSQQQQLFLQDVLVIAIPPQLKKGRTDYAEKIQQLVELAELGQVKQIILLNSTAIYNGLAGEVDEHSSLDMEANKVAPLVAAEQALFTFSKATLVLRLAGLVGPKRHPGKFLQLKREFANANSVVNLVHQADVVNIIEILSQSSELSNSQLIYNVVSKTACTRITYYQTAARALSLPAPEFSDEDQQAIGKRINGDKLRSSLHYQYQYDDLLAWLDEAIEL